MLEEISGEVFFSFRCIDKAFFPKKIPIESITLRLRLPFCLVLQRINGLVGLCSFHFSKREENNHEMGSEVGNNIFGIQSFRVENWGTVTRGTGEKRTSRLVLVEASLAICTAIACSFFNFFSTPRTEWVFRCV